ncbi:MAG: glycosyltransferase family 4 protein [Candidatus Omnitrophota bacterium]
MNIFTLTMTPINPPHDDAAKNIVLDVAKRLKDRRFFFISSFFDRDFTHEDNIYFFRSPFQRTGKHKMPRFQKLYAALCILVNIRNIEVLQFFVTPQPYFSRFFRWLIKKTSKKSIQIIPSIYTLQNKNEAEDIPGLFFGDNVVVYSDFTRDKLKGMGVRNVTRIYPGIDTGKFSEGHERREDDTFKVLYPGTYKTLRNAYSFQKFIAIVHKVMEAMENVNFVMACRIRTKEDIVLEAGFKEACEGSGVLGNFTFLNTIEDMPSLFRSCDLGIMPMCRATGGVLEIPMVLLEAASSFKPVIYGNVPPMSELSDRSLGIMLSDSSPESYADQIIQLLRDREAARLVGSRSRKAVLEHFNVDDMADRYEELYRSLERSS